MRTASICGVLTVLSVNTAGAADEWSAWVKKLPQYNSEQLKFVSTFAQAIAAAQYCPDYKVDYNAVDAMNVIHRVKLNDPNVTGFMTAMVKDVTRKWDEIVAIKSRTPLPLFSRSHKDLWWVAIYRLDQQGEMLLREM
jgi:hypothetical protein